MFGILGLGFLLGMQHALEADHIAAVSSMAARRSHVADIVKHGLTWGLGHTLTLFAFAGAAILLGRAIPETIARPIETAVGLMLIGLGAHVLWRLWRDRVHFHRHGHDDGTVHFHAPDRAEAGLGVLALCDQVWYSSRRRSDPCGGHFWPLTDRFNSPV